ncbi:hypothetical protein C8R44DRAFT_736754 [Mycena epipterygia]|nr:hypothetical protein C8R44DRAFT_736754 [Mycena epipterygia]
MLSKNPSLAQGHTLACPAELDSCDNVYSSRGLFDIIWGCFTTIFACTWVSVHPNRGSFWLLGGSQQSSKSPRHGFFIISMDGFVSRSGHHPIVTKEQLKNHGYASAIQHVDVEDIMDKSKGNTLSKGVVLLQGVWFVTQCLARVHQYLPVTELEVATLVFAVINTFIWSLWWAKPLDVEKPILVGPTKELEA